MALAAAQFAVGTASAVAQYGQQKQAAEQQNAFYNQNAVAANKAAASAYTGLNTQLTQALASSDQDVLERRIQGLKARGTANEAAGSAGVTGLSVDALINDYSAAEGRGVDSVVTNYDIEKDNILSQMEAVHHQTTARINSVQRAQPPGLLPTIIRIAGSAVGAASSYNYMRSPSFNPMYNQSLGIPT